MTVDTWMHVNPTGDLLEATRACEAAVFGHWYGNTRAQLDEEYGPYEDATVFISLTDTDGEVVAAMRLLAPGGAAGLKTLHDIGGEPWFVDGARSAAAAGLDLRTTWEVATLGALRRSGAAGVRHSYSLYRALVLVARNNPFSDFVAVLDDRVRRLLDAAGLAMRPLPGTRAAPYLGSAASTPIFAHGPALLDNQRRQSPDAFALVSMGAGLAGVAIPPDSAFDLGLRTPAADQSVVAARIAALSAPTSPAGIVSVR
jgi:hypothetical protein